MKRTTNVGLSFREDDILRAKGVIGAFMHKGDAEFVSLGSDPRQGYYKVPKDSITSEMHINNLIVDKASIYMAKRMLMGTSWGDGINYLEVGTGVGTGTTQAPQAEAKSDVALRVPLFRKAISSWTYLDINGSPTGVESNVIQLTTVFGASEANGAIVEMGLFGGLATVTNGTGYMFNHKCFPVWNKDSTVQLTIVWKLTF